MESHKNKCRICLEDNVELDWNHLLYGYGQLTYKDCYFKYTQLEYFDEDNFSVMLCRNCSNALEYIDGFISKALETHVKLVENLPIDIKFEEDVIKREASNFQTTAEETNFYPEIGNGPNEDVLVVPKESKASTTIESSIISDAKNRVSIKRETVTKNVHDRKRSSNENIKKEKISKINSKKIPIGENTNIEPGHFIDIENFEKSLCNLSHQQEGKRHKGKLPSVKKNRMKKTKNCQSLTKSPNANAKKVMRKGKTYESLEVNFEEDFIKGSEVSSNPRNETKKMLLCQYCSFKVRGTNQLIRHEATHSENRERPEICPKCGLKLFTKSTLNEHMRIHDENRQKNYKCEFCDKAFYNKGTLNVHRRIHLGLMIKCKICPKEFFRKTDLERHMNSHSATLINVEPKKRSKYLVRCTYCSKNIMSTSFKAHIAAHLNEPLLKCTICSKEFFRRDSCTDHLKLIHKKTAEEYNQFIISYRKYRLSHLYLEQTAELQSK